MDKKNERDVCVLNERRFKYLFGKSTNGVSESTANCFPFKLGPQLFYRPSIKCLKCGR